MLISSLTDFMGGNWWLQIPGEAELLFAVISFIINLVVMTIVFYVAGAIVVGKRRALFSDALVISLLGTVVGNICSLFFPVIGWILSLIVWLLLIRRYYETGWLGALAVAILAVIIYVVVWVILALIFAIPILLFAGLFSP
ncbi:MAG: hypothetical protein OEY90_04740 [Candidatus Bathyarchaeota archaeon]|jgi:hypothetical protein|nr:hypothetical protein [Candidatus Bathyarchaeota archaeon]